MPLLELTEFGVDVTKHPNFNQYQGGLVLRGVVGHGRVGKDEVSQSCCPPQHQTMDDWGADDSNASKPDLLPWLQVGAGD